MDGKMRQFELEQSQAQLTEYPTEEFGRGSKGRFMIIIGVNN